MFNKLIKPEFFTSGLGRSSKQTSEQTPRTQRASGRPSLERRSSIIRKQGPVYIAARRAYTVVGRRPSPGVTSPRSVRSEMVAGQPVPRFGRQRQPSLHLEPALDEPRADLHRALGGGQGHRLVAAPPRVTRKRRRHRGPVHQILEHPNQPADAVHRHRLAGLQPCLEQAQFRARQHPRILAEPNSRVEVPEPCAGGQTHRTLLPGFVPGYVAGRRGDRNRRGRRDAPILERF